MPLSTAQIVFDSDVKVVWEKVLPFAVALFIGLAVGIDRERHNRNSKGSMGIRTISIVAVSGAVAGQIGSSAVTAGLFLLLVAVTALSYQRSTKFDGPEDIGLTTEISAGLVFALGYLAILDRVLAAILGVVLATILFSRDYLHKFSLQFLGTRDIAAALILAVLAFIVLPLLPNQFLDPWGLFNPRDIGRIILLIGGIEFGGYILEKLLGAKIGSWTSGFLGGLVSSTAVFFNMAKLAKNDLRKVYLATTTCASATVATLVLFVGIVTMTSPSLFIVVAIPAIVTAACMGIFGYLVSRMVQNVSVATSENSSPLDVWSVLKLSLFVVSLLALTATTKTFFGAKAVEISSFMGGLFELHATAFAASTLTAAGNLEPSYAARALLLAATASMASKTIISWLIGPIKFSLIISLGIVLSFAAGVGVSLLLSAFDFVA